MFARLANLLVCGMLILAAAPTFAQNLIVAPHTVVKGQASHLLLQSTNTLSGSTVTLNGNTVNATSIGANILCCELDALLAGGTTIGVTVVTQNGTVLQKTIPVTQPVTPQQALSSFSTSVAEIQHFIRTAYPLLVEEAVMRMQALATPNATAPISAALNAGLGELDTLHACVAEALNSEFAVFSSQINAWLSANPGRANGRLVEYVSDQGGDLLADAEDDNDDAEKAAKKREEEKAKKDEELKKAKEQADKEIAKKIEEAKRDVDDNNTLGQDKKDKEKKDLDNLQDSGSQAVGGQTDVPSVEDVKKSVTDAAEHAVNKLEFCLIWVFIDGVDVYHEAPDENGKTQITVATRYWWVSSEEPVDSGGSFNATIQITDVQPNIVTDGKAQFVGHSSSDLVGAGGGRQSISFDKSNGDTPDTVTVQTSVHASNPHCSSKDELTTYFDWNANSGTFVMTSSKR